MENNKTLNPVDLLKQKISETNNNASNSTKEAQKANEETQAILNYITKLQTNNNFLKQQLDQLTNQTPLSTTQFFENSLAKDMYNMNSNDLQVNSYLAIRQLLGITNNTSNNLQPIEGLNINNQPPTLTNKNGSGVGLTTDKQIQGWWLWLMILNRIDYFANLYQVDCEDKELLKAINKYKYDVVLSGNAVIIKKDNKYINMCCNVVKTNKYGEVEELQLYNSSWVINHPNMSPDEQLTQHKLDDTVAFGSWRSNGYNVWFYVMSYLMNAVGLIYIFWNRARLNKTMILQQVGDGNYKGQEELEYFLSPYYNYVSITAAGLLPDEQDINNFEAVSSYLKNRYEIIDLGNGEQTELSFNSFVNWCNYWDNQIGISSTPASSNPNRKISDEVAPENEKTNKLEEDFKNNLQAFLDEINVKFGVTASIVEPEEETDTYFKNEGGSEDEQNDTSTTTRE